MKGGRGGLQSNRCGVLELLLWTLCLVSMRHLYVDRRDGELVRTQDGPMVVGP